MNNELKNKTKQQLISEVDKLTKELSENKKNNLDLKSSLEFSRIQLNNRRTHNDELLLELKLVSAIRDELEKENKELKENLDLADSDYQETRLRYQLYKVNSINDYRKILLFFIFSVIFNVVLTLLNILLMIN